MTNKKEEIKGVGPLWKKNELEDASRLGLRLGVRRRGRIRIRVEVRVSVIIFCCVL